MLEAWGQRCHANTTWLQAIKECKSVKERVRVSKSVSNSHASLVQAQPVRQTNGFDVMLQQACMERPPNALVSGHVHDMQKADDMEILYDAAWCKS